MRRVLTMVTMGMLCWLPPSCAPAFAQDHNHAAGHAKFHDVYQTWSIPGVSPPLSCCDAKKTVDGVTTGHCYPTEAELRPSVIHPEIKRPVWWAKLDSGFWIEVPDNRILEKEPNPDPTGVSAHICEMEGSVLCFREPVGGI